MSPTNRLAVSIQDKNLMMLCLYSACLAATLSSVVKIEALIASAVSDVVHHYINSVFWLFTRVCCTWTASWFIQRLKQVEELILLGWYRQPPWQPRKSLAPGNPFPSRVLNPEVPQSDNQFIPVDEVPHSVRSLRYSPGTWFLGLVWYCWRQRDG